MTTYEDLKFSEEEVELMHNDNTAIKPYWISTSKPKSNRHNK